MRKIQKIILLLGLGLLSTQILAANLIQVYQQALDNDPSFKMARANWLSFKENVAVTRAGLLPHFDIAAGIGRGRTYGSTTTVLTSQTTGESVPARASVDYYSDDGSYTLSLRQPIFNYENWSALKQAKAVEKQYAAQYSAAAQDLMFRAVEAYFNILKSTETLRYTIAEKQSLKSRLNQTNQRYKVGLATIIDVHQAEASYDGVVAQEIVDRNDLNINKEKLREITNNGYSSFAGVTKKLPLLYPNPADASQWVSMAQQQNYDLLSTRFAVQAAQENIKVQAAGHLPVINAEGTYKDERNKNAGGVGGDRDLKTAFVGLTATLPVFAGGGTFAKTYQAKYDYEYASHEFEKTNRSVVSETRQAYLNVISGINVIKANKQAVISTKSALDSTIAGYKVGTQTMVDVLAVQSTYYQSLKEYATSQYDYLIASVALKQATGTLSVADINNINNWLREEARPPIVKKSPVVKKKKTRSKPKIKIKSKTIVHKIKKPTYALQLLAMRNRNTVLKFKQQHAFAVHAQIVRICHHGEHWYILIMGDYPSKNAAMAAVHKLPIHIKHMHPWIRSYTDLNKVLC